MRVVYLVQNPGIASRTPDGWQSAVITPAADGQCSERDLELVAEADILVVGLFPVTETMLSRARRLKLVQRLGVGYDNIDLAAASRRGVPVCNMADFNAATVAEHTIMMMLGLLRRVFESTLLMKSGRWPTHEVISGGNHDLRGRTVGLIGLGAIGRDVARRLGPFEVRMCYHERRRLSAHEERELRVSFVSLDQLLRESDVVSVHVPHTPDTHRLLGRAELRSMKRSAILVNTARGAVIDEDALAEALRAGELAGAGLDVFAEEPLPARHPLRTCPNLLLTPHTAGQTREAMERMVEMLLENFGRVARGEEPANRVSWD
ncbi:MAG TPA: 2-hydroxyacid dehydrogenase [Gemmatimonadaceae bacterium]|nr:2-hydroxyacid dehydrogenase [Gemmatimonadaceae bacterium]